MYCPRATPKRLSRSDEGNWLPTVIKIIRAHYQEKNASELYASLSSLVQTPNEEPQNFLLRALNLREKILFASKQEGRKIEI